MSWVPCTPPHICLQTSLLNAFSCTSYYRIKILVRQNQETLVLCSQYYGCNSYEVYYIFWEHLRYIILLFVEFCYPKWCREWKVNLVLKAKQNSSFYIFRKILRISKLHISGFFLYIPSNIVIEKNNNIYVYYLQIDTKTMTHKPSKALRRISRNLIRTGNTYQRTGFLIRYSGNIITAGCRRQSRALRTRH